MCHTFVSVQLHEDVKPRISSGGGGGGGCCVMHRSRTSRNHLEGSLEQCCLNGGQLRDI